MNKFILMIIIVFTVTATNLVYAAKNTFQFQINNYHTARQGGQTLDIYVRYSMKDNIDYSQYSDYRELRNIVLPYLEPSKKLPENTFWEIIASKIGDDLMSRYPMAGISVQILVAPNENGPISEPGFHGPIYTVGDVIPFSQVVMPTQCLENNAVAN
jgi:hypothetical protein